VANPDGMAHPWKTGDHLVALLPRLFPSNLLLKMINDYLDSNCIIIWTLALSGYTTRLLLVVAMDRRK
jgi:hypothetical protein